MDIQYNEGCKLFLLFLFHTPDPMKHLYSRLALTTSLFLVLGYWLVHAAGMWVPMKTVQPEDPMTANIWNSLLGNVEFLSGGISQMTSNVNTLSGKL